MAAPVKFLLGFDVISCLGCGATREQGRACPECGKKARPREVDLKLVRRRQLVTTLRDAVKPHAPASAPGGHVDLLLDEAGELLGAILESLQEALESGNARAATQVLERFATWSAQVSGLARQRPDIPRFELLQTIKERLSTVVDEVLSAFTADMRQAQRHAQAMQSAIDGAADAAADYGLLKERLQHLRTDSVSEVARSALEIELERTGMTLLEYVPFTESSLAQSLGVKDAEVIALDVAMFSTVGEYIFDMDNYRATLRRALNVLDDPQRLRQIVSESSDFLADFTEARISLALRLWGAGKAIDHAVSDRAVAEDVVALLTSLVDRTGAFVARTLLLVSGLKQKNYDRLKQGMATTDIERARQDSSLASLVIYLDTHLRTAQSHDGVRYHATTITTTSKQHGTEEHSLDAILDRTLGAVETLHAAMSALRLSLFRAGFDIDDAPVLQAMGASTQQVATVGLSLATGLNLTVDTVGDLLAIDAKGSYSPNLLTLLAHQCLQLAPETTGIELEFTDLDGQASYFRGPSEPLRSWQSATNDPLGLLEAMAEFQLNGRPALHITAARRFAATAARDALRAAEDLPSAYRSWGQQLARLRLVAGVMGDSRLEQLISDLQRGIRTGEQDPSSLSLLEEWIRQEVVPLP